MRSVEEHRALIESYLEGLPVLDELGDLAPAVRYTLQGGGKRIRPVLCLATGEAAGALPEELLPAAAAVELVHTFSLVHDDLPALDDDAVRRGRPSAHIEFGEATAILVGDALLAGALRLAASYRTPSVARELTDATLGMIRGQHLDLSGGDGDLLALHRLKTGRLFAAAVGCALSVAEVPEEQRPAWRAFADDVGLLFQLVDDILDDDGYARQHGGDEARRLADETARRAETRLREVPAETSVLREIVASLAGRTS